MWHKKKMEKIKNYKHEQQREEEDTCTFTPKIVKITPSKFTIFFSNFTTPNTPFLTPLQNRDAGNAIKECPLNIASSSFMRSGLEKHFQRQERAKMLREMSRTPNRKKRRARKSHNSPWTTKNSAIKSRNRTGRKEHQENQGELGDAIMHLHRELHKLKI